MTNANLPALIERSRNKIAEVLPKGMDADRVVRLARLAVHRQPKLLQCDPVSVIEAIMVASQLGLEINSPVGGAHLVPYGNRCNMIPDYRGLIKLILRSGGAKKIVAREVYEEDEFRVLQGDEDRIIHIPSMSGSRRDEDIVAFYAVATLQDGTTVHEWDTREGVEAIRDRSKAGRDGPWVTDFAAMGKKTLVKRLTKWLDSDRFLGMAVEMDNRYETGEILNPTDLDDEASLAAHMSAKAAEAARNLASSLGTEQEEEVPEMEAEIL